MSKKQTSALRTARIATAHALQQAMRNTLRSARLQQINATKLHAQQQAYLAAVQALQQQMGITAPITVAVRAGGLRTQTHAQSAVQGACSIVRALVLNNPTQPRAWVLQQAALQGINPATASTQYQVARKQLLATQQPQQQQEPVAA